MAQTVIGETGWKQRRPLKTTEDASGVKRRTENWSGNEDQYAAWVPDFGDEHSTVSGIYLVGISKTEKGIVSEAELIYEPITSAGGGKTGGLVPPVGTTSWRSDSNGVDIPIEQHPSGDGDDWSNPAHAAYKAGVESYVDPQPIYEYEETIDDFVWSEASIAGQTGKIASAVLGPDKQGLEGVDRTKWLLMAKTAVQYGDVTTVTYTWQYLENGWDADIYDPIS